MIRLFISYSFRAKNGDAGFGNTAMNVSGSNQISLETIRKMEDEIIKDKPTYTGVVVMHFQELDR